MTQISGRGGPLLKHVDWIPPKSVSSNRSFTETVVAQLLIEHYLKEDFHFTPYNTISYMNAGDRKIVKPVKLNVGTGDSDSGPATKRPTKASGAVKKTKKRKSEPEPDEEVFEVSD